MINKLALIIMCAVYANISIARTVDSCVTFDDPIKAGILKQELSKVDFPYSDDGTICVTNKYKSRLYGMVSELFPPDPKKAKRLKAPPSPSSIALNSSKLENPEHNEILKNELSKRNIWFVADEEDSIWYEVTKEEVVREIIFLIAEGEIKNSQSNKAN